MKLAGQTPVWFCLNISVFVKNTQHAVQLVMVELIMHKIKYEFRTSSAETS